jgi:hypothetical protein
MGGCQYVLTTVPTIIVLVLTTVPIAIAQPPASLTIINNIVKDY